ncbi:MAG TPA: hypothetical protein VM754_00575 [Actinomycetota bacterium]|nr:hypothetical protein [Actinomycetota bacterium]
MEVAGTDLPPAGGGPVDPRDLESAFREFAGAAGVDPARDPHGRVFATMLRFYAEVRIQGCEPGDDEDMLLLDWGSYDWGEGRAYEIDLSRQVTSPEEPGDFWELHILYRFPSTGDLAAVPTGNDWWGSPDLVGEFALALESNPALAAAAGSDPLSVEIYFEPGP